MQISFSLYIPFNESIVTLRKNNWLPIWICFQKKMKKGGCEIFQILVLQYYFNGFRIRTTFLLET